MSAKEGQECSGMTRARTFSISCGITDLRVFAKQLPFEIFAEAAKRAGVRIWTCPLNLVNLVWLGVSAAWRKGDSFVTILTVTLKLLQDQEHFGQSGFGKDLDKRNRRYRDKS